MDIIAAVITSSQKKHIWNVFAPILTDPRNSKDKHNVFLKEGLISETDDVPLRNKHIKWVGYKTFYNTAAFYL